jgi:hypothetical protein
MSFYVILPSNACEKSQANNIANSFVIDWDTSIKLIGKWEVALTEYAFAQPERGKQNYVSCFIYSSIIEPILVGSDRVPLLRQVWIEEEKNDDKLLHNVVDHPMYLKVCNETINNIEIQIRNDTGQLVNFPKGTTTTLTLHFQQPE